MLDVVIDNELSVRTFAVKDAATLFRLIDLNREHLSEWFDWPGYHESVNDTRDWIVSCGKGPLYKDRDECGLWRNERLIGSFGLEQGASASRSVGVGYWLSSEEMGQGIMTKVTRVMTEHLIQKLNVNRVTIKTLVANKRSAAIPQRIKFTFEGCGARWNTVVGKVSRCKCL